MVNAAFEGDDDAVDAVWSMVYGELHAMARKLVGGKWSGVAADTMPPTAMVHELFLKMHGSVPTHWDSRAHFFGACARAMEQLLIDHHRARRRLKRGGERRQLSLWQIDPPLASPGPPDDEDIEIRLIDAIRALDTLDDRRGAVARLRCVVGLQNTEIAAALGVTPRTVQRDWQLAKAWLHQRLTGTAAPDES